MRDELLTIPGIGPKLATMLNEVGVRRIEQLRGADPEKLYHELIQSRGIEIDRCVLYTFRCAVYYASNTVHDPQKLKWWSWKDGDFL
ncbi:Pathogenicity locus [Solemya pervernicosa gill symbiont]|uniref:Pathogenicity locus n=1 Tax=Solemya pervernicosa gill symbiont TaxID=642797 RepID=A0A1T2L7D4_9GAMM|nr:helix-hairpin-helix domain-containing protein [Solemya pervernicosa gill symbiont]OOZ41015.1 Pathogenicity locus [Solemya pervernicosa gill symbiont]